MIISHKYKFIFIKTSKTASTSIEIFLSQLCDNGDIVTPIYPHVDPHVARNFKGLWNPFPGIFMNKGKGFMKIFKQLCRRKKFSSHMPARVIRSRILPKTWNNYFKFCVERNPWDKTLSHYHMLNFRSGGNMSLEEYFKKGNFSINYHRYTDNNDNLIVDKVVKYEGLSEELSSIFQELDIPFEGSLGVYAKSEYRSYRTPYQEMFSTDQKEIIARVFEKEIIMHGYVY